MRAPTKLTSGVLLHGRYRIIRLIGIGGMSYVYLAQDERLMGKYWAVKESIPLPHDREHLIREAQWLTELRHPNLPLIVDFYPPDSDGHAYMVMEYIEGETIADRLKRNTISFNEAIAYSLQLCDALSYLHERTPPIIYRDMKTSNVMVTDHRRIKLIDFGIARQVKPAELADTMKLGTVGFAAPEQHEGKQSDARTDLYGVGALLAHILTEGRWRGIEAFRSQLLIDDVPDSFQEILKKLMSLRPNDRYQSAAELKRTLMAYAEPELLHTSLYSIEQGEGVHYKRVNNSLKRGVTIAVAGIASGLGTTHTCLMIAHRLARSNRGKVAYVSSVVSSGCVVRSIMTSVEGSCAEEWMNQLWQWQGVTYIELSDNEGELNTSTISQLQTDYDFVVLDLGVFGRKDRYDEEFVRATYSMLVGSDAPWREDDSIQVVQRLNELNYQQWIYAIPHASESEWRSHRSRGSCHSIIAIPTCPNPFKGSVDVESWLLKWMGLQGRKRTWLSWLKQG